MFSDFSHAETLTKQFPNLVNLVYISLFSLRVPWKNKYSEDTKKKNIHHPYIPTEVLFFSFLDTLLGKW